MTRKQLRKHFLQRRKQLSQEHIQLQSRQITDLFVKTFSLQRYSCIHTFLPAAQNNEPDTWLLIKFIWQHQPQIKIAVPIANAYDFSMSHYLLTPDVPLIHNKWNIPEPDTALAQKVSLPEIEIVLVPLLTFDKAGRRLGYGMGFYDRFLSQMPETVMRVGISLLPPSNDLIPDVEPTDVPLHVCITPKKIHYFD